MSGNFENNKILAAFLCAGLTAMLGGFVAKKIVSPEKLKKDAVEIEGAVADTNGNVPAKPTLPDPIMALLATASAEKGAKISKACAACHSFEKGGPVKQGPNLWNIVGANKGAVPGFSYSDALIEKGGDWGYDSLNKFLWKPKKYIAGTKMNFAGLKKPQDRADMIAWLRAQGDSQIELPTEAEIAAEQLAFAPPIEEIQDEADIQAQEVVDGETPVTTESDATQAEETPSTEEADSNAQN